jgi:ATP-dependent DNA ligase
VIARSDAFSSYPAHAPEAGQTTFRRSRLHLRAKALLGKKAALLFYAFDLLWPNGDDLRKQPLVRRKDLLQKLVKENPLRWIYAQHVDTNGKELFKEICRRDLEVIVSKRKQSIYKDDGTGWLKIKNPKYSQLEGRREMGKKR